jgi:multidrug efflux pump subunit AcrA (membrane-fusion protein)
MKRRPAIGIFIAALLGAAIACFFLFTNHSRGLMIDGIVDANQVVVGPKVQGLLERLLVDEGSSVRAGERIASLDNAELTAEMEADRAAVENLRAQLRATKSVNPATRGFLFVSGIPMLLNSRNAVGLSSPANLMRAAGKRLTIT